MATSSDDDKIINERKEAQYAAWREAAADAADYDLGLLGACTDLLAASQRFAEFQRRDEVKREKADRLFWAWQCDDGRLCGTRCSHPKLRRQ